MKFCIKCGQEIKENEEVCPYCGSKIIAKNKDHDSMSSPVETCNDNNFKIIFLIIKSTICLIGLILVIVFAVKELNFNSQYDLSQLSDKGIDVLRSTTGNDLNIIMIIIGSLLFILPSFFNVIVKIIQKNNK